jgi:hypothetical protein
LELLSSAFMPAAVTSSAKAGLSLTISAYKLRDAETPERTAQQGGLQA